MGLDPLQVHFPSQVLPIDLAHIGHEEGIFLAWAAPIRVDVPNPTHQGTLDQRLATFHAISILRVTDDQVSVKSDICIFFCCCRKGRRCHNHAEAAGAKIYDVGERVVLGRLEDVRGETGWARPSGLFLVKRKNLLGLPMRQLKGGRRQRVVAGSVQQESGSLIIGLQQEEANR